MFSAHKTPDSVNPTAAPLAPPPPSGGASEFGSGQKPRPPHTHPCGRSHPSNPGRGAGELRGSLPIYNKLSPVKVVNYGLSRRRLRGMARNRACKCPKPREGRPGAQSSLEPATGMGLEEGTWGYLSRSE